MNPYQELSLSKQDYSRGLSRQQHNDNFLQLEKSRTTTNLSLSPDDSSSSFSLERTPVITPPSPPTQGGEEVLFTTTTTTTQKVKTLCHLLKLENPKDILLELYFLLTFYLKKGGPLQIQPDHFGILFLHIYALALYQNIDLDQLFPLFYQSVLQEFKTNPDK